MKTGTRLRRALALSIAATAALLSMSACASGAESDASTEDLSYHIRVAPWQEAYDLGFWAAVSQGYFEDEGVDVEVTSVDASIGGRNALIAGDVDLAHVSLTTSLPAFEAGEPVVAVASVFETWATDIVVSTSFLEAKGYTADEFRALPIEERYEIALDGADVLGNNPGDITDQVIREQYRLLGVDDVDEVGTVNYLQNNSALEASFQGGKGDVYWGRESVALWYEENGYGVIVSDGDEQAEQFPSTELPAGTFLANSDWLADNGDAVTAFLAAWTKGNEWVEGRSEDELADWALELNSDVTGEEAQSQLVETVSWLRTQANWDGRLDDEVVQRIIDFGLTTGSISSPIDIDDVVDWSYLPAAS